MYLEFKHLDELLISLCNKNTLEENLSSIIRNIEDEIKFNSLGIYLKQTFENYYRVKNHRHLSHHFVKESLISTDHPIINQIKNNKYLRTNDEQYKFEYDFKELIIFPLSYQEEFLGFMFIDKQDTEFSDVDISKLNVFVSAICIQIFIYKLQGKIERLTELDSVTGIYNHKYFVKNCQKNHALMKRYTREYSLCLLKINKLDEITQVIGNHKIPLFLKEISEILTTNIRETDFCGILFPDTFGIFYAEINKETASMVAERIHNILIKNPRLTAVQFKWGINDNKDNVISFDEVYQQTEEALNESVRINNKSIVIYNKAIN